MKLKKILLIIALVGVAVAGWPENLDVIVMVDTSESMFPVFDDVVNYLLRDLLENRLHTGDSFHLLSFADTPEQEIQLDIRNRGDIATVVDRILLLRPLGQYTDLVAAVEFLYSYTEAIGGQNRKLILLLTDGIHDPPPGSPNRLDKAGVVARLLESSEKIKREGWDVHILRMPGGEAEAKPPVEREPGIDVLDQLSDQLESDVLSYEDVEKENLTNQLTGFSALKFPDSLGRVRRRFNVPLAVQNNSEQPREYVLVGMESAYGELLRRPGAVAVPAKQTADLAAHLRLPRGMQPGVYDLRVSLEFSDPQLRISPLQGTLTFDYVPLVDWRRSRLHLPYLLYALGALILIGVIILLVFVIRHRLQDAAFDRLFAGVAETRRRRKSIRPLIMKVDSQNPNIGTRNIHPVSAGSRRSVGGDGSTFLIYYIPVPRRIGDIRNDGKKYSFVPRRPEYFPDLGKPLDHCLDKPIRAVSSRGREITFHFHEYISPLEQLNRLMRSVPKYHIGDVPLKQSTGEKK